MTEGKLRKLLFSQAMISTAVFGLSKPVAMKMQWN
jgi:hypothetical protein